MADVSSDGFPDIMLTAVNSKGGTSTFVLMNSPCTNKVCSSDSRDSMRRIFTESQNARDKFATDEIDVDPRDFLNQVFQ